jgi:UDP-N-acetylmuramate dehydrogenase
MQILRNISLRPYNTFGIDVKAEYFAELASDAEVAQFYTSLKPEMLPVLVLGYGSNILFTKDYTGTVAVIRSKGIQKLLENETHVFLKVAAGEVWDDVVKYAVENKLGGIENLSGIPGSAGAAPVQNIGAYGVEIRDALWAVEAADVVARHYRAFRPADCEFGYRTSLFKTKGRDRIVITGITLRLAKTPALRLDYGDIRRELEKEGVTEPTVADVRRVVLKIRCSKLPEPSVLGNAGSFFTNPLLTADEADRLKEQFPSMPSFSSGEKFKVPAAWLIEQCGWKGKRFGYAGVHENQPLVLVNHGNASGADILKLSAMIVKSVEEKFGITLTPEVGII